MRGSDSQLSVVSPEPVFERDAFVTLPGRPPEQYSFAWMLEGPLGREELLAETGLGGSEIRLPLTYPYSGKTVSGAYRYQLHVTGASGTQWVSEVVELTLSPYRFGC